MLLRCMDHGNQSRHQRKRELYTGGMNKMISDNKLKEFQKNIQIPVIDRYCASSPSLRIYKLK